MKSIIKNWKKILNVLNIIFADRDSKHSTMAENLEDLYLLLHLRQSIKMQNSSTREYLELKS
jgi:hypothetical protein